MPLPWLRLIDGVLGATDIVRWVRGRPAEDKPSAPRGLENRLQGVVIGALREAFDRDHERLDIERQRLSEERLRAERATRLELLRQAGDREIGRQRLLACVAVAGLIGSLLLVTRMVGGAPAARAALALGWLMLIAALGAAFTAQSQVARSLGRADDRASAEEVTKSAGGLAAPALIVLGLGAIAVGVLLA